MFHEVYKKGKSISVYNIKNTAIYKEETLA